MCREGAWAELTVRVTSVQHDSKQDVRIKNKMHGTVLEYEDGCMQFFVFGKELPVRGRMVWISRWMGRFGLSMEIKNRMINEKAPAVRRCLFVWAYYYDVRLRISGTVFIIKLKQ